MSNFVRLLGSRHRRSHFGIVVASASSVAVVSRANGVQLDPTPVLHGWSPNFHGCPPPRSPQWRGCVS